MQIRIYYITINWISFSKERLSGNLETLGAKLRRKVMSLIQIYDQK